jgi:mono/diheme cytochrome c family protein
MKKRALILIVGLALAGVFMATPAPQGGAATAQTTATTSAQLATMKEYCATCHSDKAKMAGVSFEGVTPASITEHPEVFEKAIKKLRGRVMPPPGAKQPDAKAADALVAYLEDTLDKAETKQHIRDKVVLHRLNRKEYANAIRDLLHTEFEADRTLPPDDTVEGFDNIATGLQVSPSFIEQYTISAYLVAVKAIGKPDARPSGWSFRAGSGSQLTHVAGLPLGTRGGVLGQVDLPSDGEYVVNIPDLVTHIWGNGMEFENPLIVTLDNKVVYETVIGGEEDMKQYDQVLDGALDRVNIRLKNIKFQATAGPHKIGVTFRRRTFAESDDQQEIFGPGGGQDRLYRIPSFQLQGPFNPKGLSATPSRERIFICHPDKGANAATCSKQIISTIAKRAYRRPVTDADMKELQVYYDDGFKQGGFESGIRAAITGVLASPFFLYRGERVPAGLRPGDTYKISDLELASMLSFFLWNTIPDDELLDLAIASKLSAPATLEKQVKRMLADPRSETLGSNFTQQWLDMKRLDEIVPDSVVFPYASGRNDPREDFRTELSLFADSIYREDRSVVDLLSANHTYLNERVALHYGINDVKGDKFRRVELKDSVRWGLMGKGAILMAAAYPNRTSPVLRGAFILKEIQGVPPAMPPADVPTLNDADIGTQKALTVRELIAKHRASPTCSSCHAVMDPLGFALENFDAVGQWRDRDRYANAVIDSAGELPDGTVLKGPDDLRKALLGKPDQFAQTFTERLLMYATGNKTEYYDMTAVRRIVDASAKNGYKFSSIVQGIVGSEQFRMRRAPAASASVASK